MATAKHTLKKFLIKYLIEMLQNIIYFIISIPIIYENPKWNFPFGATFLTYTLLFQQINEKISEAFPHVISSSINLLFQKGYKSNNTVC